MTRGTTPTLVFEIPYLATDIHNAWLTVAQHGQSVINLDLEALEVADNQITATLTQQQTLRLVPGDCQLQLRLLLDGQQAVASQQIEVHVHDILRDGVI